MSLQTLNPEVQQELIKPTPKSKPLGGMFQKLRTNNVGTLLRGEYPDSRRLEELLVEFE
jgi:hypothetical protein